MSEHVREPVHDDAGESAAGPGTREEPRLHGPLTGVSVLDLGIMAAGPATGVFLAALGAEVLKIEPPAGDGTRWVHPTQNGVGTNFLAMNVGKRDAIVDLKRPDGRDAVYELARHADVFLQNMATGVAERLGVGYADLRPVNQQLVYCAISGYGRVGPLAREKAHDLTLQAVSAFARLNGSSDEELEHFRFSGFIDLVTAANATNAIIAGLLERELSGRGQEISVSMLEASLEVQHTVFNAYLQTGVVPVPQGSSGRVLAPDRAYAAGDEPVFLTVRDEVEWARFCAALGVDGLVTDPRFATNASRLEHREELDGTLAAVIRGKPAMYWVRMLRRAGIPATTQWSLFDVELNRQLEANDMLVTLDTFAGRIVVGGLPWHFSRTPGQITGPPVPGESTQELARIASEWASRRRGRRAARARAAAPLMSGLRVVEVGAGISGAIAALRLQDLGAEVVRLDLNFADGRTPASVLDDILGNVIHRGKRRVEVLASDETVIADLLRSADVVICSQSAGTSEPAAVCTAREAARDGHADHIWVDISDHGSHGPLAGRDGSELTIQAMAGYTEWLGKKGSDPVRLGADVATCSTATFAAGAALAGLFARLLGHGGQQVEVSRLNSLITLATIHIAGQSDPDDFEGPRVMGPFYPPQRGWRTAGRSIAFSFGGAVGAEGRPGWEAFVESIGAGWMLEAEPFASDRFGVSTTGIGPLAEACKPAYESVFANFDDGALVNAIRAHGGVAAPYLSYADLLDDPQLRALGVIAAAPPNTAGVARTTAYPAHFSATRGRFRWVAEDAEDSMTGAPVPSHAAGS